MIKLKISETYILCAIIYFSILLASFSQGEYIISMFLSASVMIIIFAYFLYVAFHLILSDYQKTILSFRQRKLLSNTVIIPYYEPPSKIHPAIAGYLIDKKIGKRESLATLFNSIINGYIAIDEKLIDNKYEYFLIKNKGFDENNLCDRLISNYLFNDSGNTNDVIPFNNLSTNIWGRDHFVKFIISEVINLKYFSDPYEYYYVDDSKSLDSSSYIKALENNFNSSPHPTRKQEDRAKKELEYYKTLYEKYANNKNCKDLPKFRHRKLKTADKFSNRPMSYTELGAQERAKWLGFKDYLQTAERFRLDKEKLETFSKYLPYAVALGVETQWTNRFEDMDIDRVEWFRSQKDESIRRHDDHGVKFKHLIRFMGRIYTK